MVVHLRSGDVFGRDPSPGLLASRSGQLHGCRRSRGHPWGSPGLPGLGPPASCPAGAVVPHARRRPLRAGLDDRRTDLATLMGAGTLCISKGTLGLSAAWMSPRLERVYVARGTHVRELRRLGVEVIEAVPPTPLGPWQASPEQVAGLFATPTWWRCTSWLDRITASVTSAVPTRQPGYPRLEPGR
jgi:hypothetical protein